MGVADVHYYTDSLSESAPKLRPINDLGIYFRSWRPGGGFFIEWPVLNLRVADGSRKMADITSRTIGVPVYWFPMEYRGKTYTIVQGIGPNSWKWKVRLDEKTVKSGEAPSRDGARADVV